MHNIEITRMRLRLEEMLAQQAYFTGIKTSNKSFHFGYECGMPYKINSSTLIR
jgi:hypothetical protein